jgi:hypothetical protein
MTKHGSPSPGIDLKQFFEASVDAMQNENISPKPSSHKVRHNCALVQRTRVDGTQMNQALTDAARALTALWRI